jgi:hypothetical protein
MKKLLVYIYVLMFPVLFISCATDGEPSPLPVTESSTITFKVNGVQKIYTSVAVTESIYTFEDQSVPSYSILATPTEDNGEYVAIQVRRDYTGTEGLYQLIYNDGTNNNTNIEGFVLDITSNDGGNLAGTFSGPLQLSGTETGVTITEGSFDINF